MRSNVDQKAQWVDTNEGAPSPSAGTLHYHLVTPLIHWAPKVQTLSVSQVRTSKRTHKKNPNQKLSRQQSNQPTTTHKKPNKNPPNEQKKHPKTQNQIKQNPRRPTKINTEKCYIILQNIKVYKKFHQFVIYLKGRYETLPDNISLYTSSGDSLRYIIYFWKKTEKEKDHFKTSVNNFKSYVYYKRHN